MQDVWQAILISEGKNMWRNMMLAGIVFALAACGSSNSDGSVASGPLGQQPLMTQQVETATRQGIGACVNVLRNGASLSALETQGFVAWRGGYRLKIDNPLIFAGGSSVSAEIKRETCRVTTGPVYPIEIQTVIAITRDELSGFGQRTDAQFRRLGDKTEIVLR